MGFSILAKSLVGMGLRGALFDAQTLSYRMLTMRTYRNRVMPIGSDPKVFNPDNRFYDALKNLFDLWDANAVNTQLSIDDDLTRAVKSVVHMRGKRRIKRAKKQSTRVIREVRKMWNQKYYGEDHEIKEAVELIHKAFRESFLTVRPKLRPELYASIPKDLKITIDEKVYSVSSLYEFDNEMNKYILRRDIVSTTDSLRQLQLTIAPYIFEKIYIR